VSSRLISLGQEQRFAYTAGVAVVLGLLAFLVTSARDTGPDLGSPLIKGAGS